MPTRTKKLVNLTLRCSDPFRAAVHAAAESAKVTSAEWLVRVVGRALAESGVALPPEIPEYRSEEAPAATLNAALERQAAELLPEARAKAGPWAESTARGEWDLIRSALREIDDPALWNDFIQSWSLPGRTARQKLHALKFRLQAYRQRDSLPVH